MLFRRATCNATLFLCFGLVISCCSKNNADETPDGMADGDTKESGASDSSGTDSSGMDSSPPADPPPRAIIYQLVVRHFGNRKTAPVIDGTLEQNGSGKFVDVNEKAITSLKDMGFTHIWLTGVLRQATLTDWSAIGLPPDDPDVVKGRAGSFYAVRDYFDVSPDYAVDPAKRLAEFDDLVKRIHAAGLKVLIDLVPNHVARGYQSTVKPDLDFGKFDDQSKFFSPTNNFYYLAGGPLSMKKPARWNPPGVTFDGKFAREDGSAGHIVRVTGNNVLSRDPGETDWYETVKLNWGLDFVTGKGSYDPIPATWTVVDQILASWQGRGVDGFRCDFAHYVPKEAWRFLTKKAKERDSKTFFMAEAYEDLPGLLDSGLDAVYNDAVYDTLKRVYQGKASGSDLDTVLSSLDDPSRGKYVHYLENHDERRIASPIVPSGGPDDSGFGSPLAGKQLAPIAYLWSQGPVLFYNGQEVGEDGSGVEGFGNEDGRTSIFDYWSLPKLQEWVNGGVFDGAGLDDSQKKLRAYYSDLLKLAKDPLVRGNRYWGLRYHNNSGKFSDANDGIYPFARFLTDGGKIMVVAVNFTPGKSSSGMMRIPDELANASALRADGLLTVKKILDSVGATSTEVTRMSRADLVSKGFLAEVGDQSASVYLIQP